MSANDVITEVHDPLNVLGKQFSFKTDGEITKKSAVSISVALAVQHLVPDVRALEMLLARISEDSHNAIINSVFPLIPVGTPFLILSEGEFRSRGIERDDKSVKWPVTINFADKDYLALGRFKEHTAPSSWQLLDRDVDEHTPEHYANLDYDGWLAEIDKLMPGVSTCARLRALSSSARVSVQGKTAGGGNGHTWIQVAKPSDVRRMQTAIKARALDLGMAWKKPKRSRTTNEVVGHDIVSIIDWSVFTTGRLVFAGKPEARDAI